MEFDEYLKGKKIDPAKFKNSSPEIFEEWGQLFSQVHPESFTQQKLFLINKARRANPYTEAVIENKPTAAKAMRPKIKPLKPKTS